MKKCVYVIIDGQAGSCGKGKVAGEFALEQNPKMAISNNMPNAGHTFQINGKKYIFRTFPVSVINKNTKILIGPSSEINMDVLEEEYERNKEFLDGREIIVHPMVPLIEKRHIEWEKEHIKTGSTFEGCSACLMEKISRNPNLKYFRGYKNMIASWDRYYEEIDNCLQKGEKILLEGSQGCDLDLNHSGNNPYTTSRQISVEQMFADTGISSDFKKEVIMVIRPFPIRISNTIYNGSKIYSGDYGKGEELDWDRINVGAFLEQYPTALVEDDLEDYLGIINYDFTEYTTVTKQVRRVFDFDIEMLKHNVKINRPNKIYLNFFEHLSSELYKARGNEIDFDLGRQDTIIEFIEDNTGVPIYRLGTGADFLDFIDMNNHYPHKLIRKKYF